MAGFFYIYQIVHSPTWETNQSLWKQFDSLLSSLPHEKKKKGMCKQIPGLVTLHLIP